MYRVAVVGATGLVGTEILRVLNERKFPIKELYMVASEKSVGSTINYEGKNYEIIGNEKAISLKPDIAIFSAGSATSLTQAPLYAQAGAFVIDNSSAWRMAPDKKLIVPEINANVLTPADKIIANPNCSTIQMVIALAPLHKRYKIKRIVVSTYQSVTGTGKKAVDQLMDERTNAVTGEALKKEKAYPYRIDLNIIPQIDVFTDNGYTKEEMKMVNETRKIMGDDTIQLTATTVRIPVMGGHSESVNVEFENEYELNELRNILQNTPGIIVKDDIKNLQYPMPIDSHNRDEVFVGRIRRDESQPKTINMWIVADNLRKGAATNAVQIAEYLVSKNFITTN